MFGLMVPKQPDLAYRSLYSRCCQIQRRLFGLVSLPALNHDAVFLYACGLDAGAVPEFEMPVQRCCRLRRLRPKPHRPELDLGRFAGAVSLLLAEAKLRDDLRDGPGRLARIGLFALGRSIARARRYFDSLDPAFLPLIGRLTAEQVALETGSPTFEEFVSPTARAVSAVARLVPGSQDRPRIQEAMAQIGYHLGAAIVAADCATDWKSDLARKQFNPVTTEKSAVLAAQMAADHMEHVRSIAADAFGPDARSTRLAVDVATRLREQGFNPAVASDPPAPLPTNALPKPLDGCVRFADAIGRAAPCPDRKPEAEKERPRTACPRVLQGCSYIISGLSMLGGCVRDHHDE